MIEPLKLDVGFIVRSLDGSDGSIYSVITDGKESRDDLMETYEVEASEGEDVHMCEVIIGDADGDENAANIYRQALKVFADDMLGRDVEFLFRILLNEGFKQGVKYTLSKK